MNGEAFLDSNILIYTFDEVARRKQRIAHDLVKKALHEGNGIISYQVVQEVLNVLTRQVPFSMDAGDAARHLATTLEPLWQVQPSAALLRCGLSLQTRYQLRFYNSLIVAAAHSGVAPTSTAKTCSTGNELKD